MHPDAVLRAEVAVRADGFGRIHVERLHEPAGLIGADSQHRDVGRSQPQSYVREMRRVPRIPAEIDEAASTLDHVAAPETLLPVEQAARGAVLCRYENDAQSLADRRFVPPIELTHVREPEWSDQTRVPGGNENGRRESTKPLQRCEVEMVIVIVTEQNEIDFGQGIERDTGLAHPPRAKPCEHARPLRPDRVRQDRNVTDLNEKGRVIDERNGDVVICQCCIELRHTPVLDQTRPPTAGLAQHLEDVPQRRFEPVRQGRVEKAVAIEMVGNRPLAPRARAIRAPPLTQQHVVNSESATGAARRRMARSAPRSAASPEMCSSR